VPLPPCFHLADDVFPKVRAEAARHLVQKGWSQTRVADAIGISQGMVSKHVTSKAPEVEPLVARLTEELLRDLDSGRGSTASPWCSTLSLADERVGGHEALDDLLGAERMLRAAMPLRFMPQIGLNIARALADAKTPDDILSYPGRLVEAGGALLAPAAPAFGASSHLARCLLHARKSQPALLAIANVKGGPPVLKAAKQVGWRVVQISADRKGDAEAPFRRAFDGQATPPTVLHDGKAPGIEPCLYLLGNSAAEVGRDILKLEEAGD
jgi:predicted fused transcriptional regulator/phosphomethylpyrimidine kinase